MSDEERDKRLEDLAKVMARPCGYYCGGSCIHDRDDAAEDIRSLLADYRALRAERDRLRVEADRHLDREVKLEADRDRLREALDDLVMACELPGQHCEVEQALPAARAALASGEEAIRP